MSVGVRQGERVQILSGVQAGEQVVTSGGLGLDDKAKVAIQQPKSEDETKMTRAATKQADDAKAQG